MKIQKFSLWLTVVGVVAVSASCANGSEDEAEPRVGNEYVTEVPTSDGATCTVDGVEFTTPNMTCDYTISAGRTIVAELGLATETPAVEQLIANTCHAMQGDEEVPGDAETIELAQRLNDEDVCSGDPGLIVPA